MTFQGVKTSTIEYAWGVTPVGSTVQILFLDILEVAENLEKHLAQDKDMPTEVLHFACKFASNCSRRDWALSYDDRCMYHEHEEGENCLVDSRQTKGRGKN